MAIDELSKLVPILVGIGIVLTIGFLIFAEVIDFAEGEISATQVNNESVTWTNNTVVGLAHTDALDVTCLFVYNNLSGSTAGTTEVPANTTLTAANYTCSNKGILVNDIGGLLFNISKNVRVSYTYKAPNYAYNGTQETTNATASIPGWLGIFVIAIIGLILIGMVRYFRS